MLRWQSPEAAPPRTLRVDEGLLIRTKHSCSTEPSECAAGLARTCRTMISGVAGLWTSETEGFPWVASQSGRLNE